MMTNTANQKLYMEPPLMGFEDIFAYTFRPDEDNPCFFWLEAENGPKFLLTKPEYFFPEYLREVKSIISSNTVESKNEEKLPDVYVIITLRERVADMTANLMAPLLINHKKLQASQQVLYESDYTTRHYLFPPTKRRKIGRA